MVEKIGVNKGKSRRRVVDINPAARPSARNREARPGYACEGGAQIERLIGLVGWLVG